jgi:radical SAM enzyme (TIGR01210 family)
LNEGETKTVASRLHGENSENQQYDRYSWRAVSPRFGGGLQLQIGTQSFGCIHFRKDFIGCLNCGLATAAAGRLVTSSEIVAQIESALKDSRGELDEVSQVCIQGDGSFLSPLEVPKEAAYAVARRLKKLSRVHTITMETRFDLVERDLPYILAVKSLLMPDKRLEVALGLESASEFVRNVVFRKGSSRKCGIERILGTLADSDVDVLLYIFIKPALLTEAEAVFDAVRTVFFVHSIAARAPRVRWTAALEPSFVQPDTFLAWLYARGAFLPPYLWSIAEIIKRTA